jgi:quercetin dioxygenase-like cupin family protein
MIDNTKKSQADLKSEAHVLGNLIEYQDEAVVSRTLIKKSTGTVTLFAFDTGEGLSEHTSPFDAMVFNIEGEAEIKISGNISALREGEMIIMPSYQPHSLKALSKFKMLLVMIKS